jgi:dTDP-glucose 4,6-dehydratase/UDP-glucose 4-epimerase
MNILIIGSKGFIGSHCTKYFSLHHHVWQCDVIVDYTLQNYIQIDASNADFSEVMQQQIFDVCINCSGAASVSDSIKNPQRDFILNTLNVFKQLDAIRKYNPNCKYINLSSAAVYGNPKSFPISENHPLNPISPYGVHKKMSEDICEEFNKIFNIRTCTLRIFSAYGEGLKKQIFWDLHIKAKTSSSVNLFGTGNESRDFIYISDLVHAIDTVIKNCKFNNDIINIANSKEVSIKSVVELFYKNYNRNISVKFIGSNREGDPINWFADIIKLSSLGYKQKVFLEKGLNNYYRWIQKKVLD